MAFEKVTPRPDFQKMEQEILDYWEKNKIFEKSVEKPAPQGNFVFFEGPPTANGRPGIHHVEARAFKDLFPRYKTMQGYRVVRKAGWDTHGLPVELEVEKSLGFEGKKDIEKYGIEKFNQKCKSSVWKYKKDWEEMTRRIGFWLDLENPYITFENDYIESLWWIIKEAWKKGLLFEGHKVVPYCPRCGTALSSHEVAQGYQKVEEKSVFVKFKIQNAKGKIAIQNAESPIYFLAWTTTPWTLPGNVALALGDDIDYTVVRVKDEYFILAKEKIEVVGENYQIIKEFQGKDLVGIEYERLYDGPLKLDHAKKVYPNIYRTVLADFVTTDEGTGIVHTAVMYGEDDYELGKKLDLPMIHTVDEQGRFKEIFTYLPKGIVGKFVKDVEKDIITDLKKRGLLFKSEMYAHDYPFCWRCKTPLLYYAKESWFIKMSALRQELAQNNKKISWVPAYLKEGRFGKWLAEVKDWAISRERYWGTPLPIWQCTAKDCREIQVVGSAKELHQFAKKKIDDFHRPFIDQLTGKCPKCQGVMKRVEAVLDCWFDSGAMPFAQYHYPFENKEKIERGEQYPADFICEAIDQTRGWFYTLLAVSTLLAKGPSYRNVISLGHVLDAKGQKMSKSRGNVIDPFKALDQYGPDVIRWFFYTVNKPQAAKNFDPQILKDIHSRFILTLWNSYVFFITYARIDRFKPQARKEVIKPQRILDQWIVSRFAALNKKIVQDLDAYNVLQAVKAIEHFVDDLSNWYIRRSRRRFWKSEDDQDKMQGYQTLYFVLENLSRILAPFTPFLAEEIYRNLTEKESVHLADFPQISEKQIDQKLNAQMQFGRKIVALGLNLRGRAKIKVRQPLSTLVVVGKKAEDLAQNKELLDLIQEEMNVKKILISRQRKARKGWLGAEEEGIKVFLDPKLTRKLRDEGMVRDLVRAIQQTRKKAGLAISDRIKLALDTKDQKIAQIIDGQKKYIERETLVREWQRKIARPEFEDRVKIEDREIVISLKKA